MTEQKTGRDWSVQRELDLPRAIVEAWRATLESRGHTGSTLLYAAVIRAAEYARDGRTDLLPMRSSAPSTAGDQLTVKWKTPPEESRQVTELLRTAGSSVRAVVAAYVQAYVEAGGDLLALSWPQREDSAAA